MRFVFKVDTTKMWSVGGQNERKNHRNPVKSKVL